MINLTVEKAVGARRSEGSHRSVHRQYVRMRVRRDNEASAPYRRFRVSIDRLLFALIDTAESPTILADGWR